VVMVFIRMASCIKVYWYPLHTRFVRAGPSHQFHFEIALAAKARSAAARHVGAGETCFAVKRRR